MNVSDPGASRPDFYDRNPLNATTSNYVSRQGPLASTQQWTYTVPANRKAQVLGLECIADQNGAFTSQSRFDAFINITPNGGSVKTICMAENVGMVAGTAPNTAHVGMPGPMLLAGDAMTGTFRNDDASGLCQLLASASIIEFDA